MNDPAIHSLTENDFNRARMKGFFADALARITGRPNEPVSFEAVKQSLKTFGQSYRGIVTVPIDKIVGSSTLRYNDFDRAFLPLQSRTKSRWRSIDRAYYEDKLLPPVQLYQVGEVYFVRDGHHRISVARERGQTDIDAEVIQVQTRVPLSPDLLATDLEIVGEYADFVERTQIDKLRPDQTIQFSEPGGYARLLEHIAVHRYFIGEEQQHKIPWSEAVADWYDKLYLPVVQIVRDHKMLNDFPRRTEADLYLWIMDHHYYLHEHDETIELEDAAVDFAEHYSERIDKRLLNAVKQAVAEFLDSETLKPMIATFTSEPHPEEKENPNEES